MSSLLQPLLSMSSLCRLVTVQHGQLGQPSYPNVISRSRACSPLSHGNVALPTPAGETSNSRLPVIHMLVLLVPTQISFHEGHRLCAAKSV